MEIHSFSRPIVLGQGCQTCGRLGSTVPLTLAVSGAPSPFLLVLGSLVLSSECLVSVLDKPSCFPDCVFFPPADFEAAAWDMLECWSAAIGAHTLSAGSPSPLSVSVSPCLIAALLSRRALFPPLASGVLLRVFFSSDFSSTTSPSELLGVSSSLPPALLESSDFSLSPVSSSAGFPSSALFSSTSGSSDFSSSGSLFVSSSACSSCSSCSSLCSFPCAPCSPWWSSPPDGQRKYTEGAVTATAPAALTPISQMLPWKVRIQTRLRHHLLLQSHDFHWNNLFFRGIAIEAEWSKVFGGANATSAQRLWRRTLRIN